MISRSGGNALRRGRTSQNRQSGPRPHLRRLQRDLDARTKGRRKANQGLELKIADLAGLYPRDHRLRHAGDFRELPLERFINWLQKWTYDIAARRMLGSVRFNPDFARELAVIAARVEPLAALRLHRKLVRDQRNIHHPLNGRLYIESVLLAYAAIVDPQRKAA